MKNIDIVGVANAYMTQRQAGSTIKLPARVAWIRRVNLNEIMKAKQLIDDALKEISARYQDEEHSVEETAADGKKKRIVRPEYVPEFVKEQSEILMQETDIAVKKISIDDICDIELSDVDMDTIAFMLKGDDD